MKPIGFAGCFFFLLASASLAEAADLQISKAPPFLPPPSFSWTGFYLGGNVGAGFGTTERRSILKRAWHRSFGKNYLVV
jgi:outer membrane immunogenic protein